MSAAPLPELSETEALVAEVRETHRMHQDLLRAEVRLKLQIKAIYRRFGCVDRKSRETQLKSVEAATPFDGVDQRPSEPRSSVVGAVTPCRVSSCPSPDGDAPRSAASTNEHVEPQSPTVDAATLFDMAELASLPLQEAMAGIRPHQLKLRRRLEKLARQLPAASAVQAVHGLGWFGFAQIVGEAGDLRRYRNPAKLWKRMGLAVIDGRAQRRVRGEQAQEQGYCAARRAIMFTIGEALIKKQNAYREMYLARKAYEAERLPQASKMYIHRRAHRYMEKRLLRDLWQAWRAELAQP